MKKRAKSWCFISLFSVAVAQRGYIRSELQKSGHDASLNANYENVRRPRKITHFSFWLLLVLFFFHFFILNGIINFENFFKITFSNLTLKSDKNMFLKKKKKKKKNFFLLIIRAIIYFLRIFLYLKFNRKYLKMRTSLSMSFNYSHVNITSN